MNSDYKYKFISLDEYIPPLQQITSVAVVAFDDQEKLILADLPRGPDLPGGHIEEDETSITQTAQREAYEEARITLSHLAISSVIESDYYGEAPQKQSYMVIMVGEVAAFHENVTSPDEKSQGRLRMTPSEFLSSYTAADPQFMQSIIEQALDKRNMPGHHNY